MKRSPRFQAVLFFFCIVLPSLGKKAWWPINHAVVPSFEINLDVRPQDRWVELIKVYSSQAIQIMQVAIEQIPSHLRWKLLLLADSVESFWPKDLELREEMEGIATRVDLPVGEVLLVNIYYEFIAACTSIVGQHVNGTMFHGRNVDFGIPSLRNITVNVNFTKGGELLYQGTTFVGYVGLLTGMRPGAFSLSLNQRNTHSGNLWDNLAEAIFHGAHSTAFLYRSLLESPLDYDNALHRLATTPLIAPGYHTIAGTHSGQGAVVSRSRNTAVDVWTIHKNSSKQDGAWFLVQTNDDHWLPPQDERREATNRNMNSSCSPETLSSKQLFQVLSTPPTLNRGTIHTTLMTPGTGEYFSVTQHYTERSSKGFDKASSQ